MKFVAASATDTIQETATIGKEAAKIILKLQ